jgi:hypothetical protein
VIEELSPDDPFMQFAKRLRKLKYPEDAKLISHLSYEHFCYWLYGMDPKEALFLTNDCKFRLIQERMRNKSLLNRFYDWVWRGAHGFNCSVR